MGRLELIVGRQLAEQSEFLFESDPLLLMVVGVQLRLTHFTPKFFESLQSA